VHQGGDQLLAGARLPAHEHRDVLGTHARNRLQELLHGGRLGDDGAAHRLLRRQPSVLHAQRARLEGAVDDQAHLIDVERLGDVLVSAGLHRPHRHALGAVRGEQHHRQGGVALVQLLQELHAVHPRHGEVGDHRVHALDERECLLRRFCQRRFVAARLEQLLQREEERRLVVNQQDSRHRFSSEARCR
jgi:hypothetical protein